MTDLFNYISREKHPELKRIFTEFSPIIPSKRRKKQEKVAPKKCKKYSKRFENALRIMDNFREKVSRPESEQTPRLNDSSITRASSEHSILIKYAMKRNISSSSYRKNNEHPKWKTTERHSPIFSRTKNPHFEKIRREMSKTPNFNQRRANVNVDSSANNQEKIISTAESSVDEPPNKKMR